MSSGSDPVQPPCDLPAQLSQPVTALTLATNHWDDLSDPVRRDLVQAAKLRLEGLLSTLTPELDCSTPAAPTAAEAATRLLDVVSAVLPDLGRHEVVVRLSGLEDTTVALPQAMTEAVARTIIANVLQHAGPPLRIDVRGGTHSAVLQLVGESTRSTTDQAPFTEPLADPRPTDDQARAAQLGRLLRNMLAERHNVTIAMDEPPDSGQLSITLRLPTVTPP